MGKILNQASKIKSNQKVNSMKTKNISKDRPSKTVSQRKPQRLTLTTSKKNHKQKNKRKINEKKTQITIFKQQIKESNEDNLKEEEKKQSQEERSQKFQKQLKKQNITKDMHCYFEDLIKLLEEKSGMDIAKNECENEKQIKIRNEELFPFLKQKAVICGNKENSQIMLSRDNANELVNILAKIFPQLQNYAKQFTITFQDIPWKIRKNIQEQGEKIILIRKKDLNLHKYDTRNKNLLKMLDQSGDYIDELDLEMLRKKQRFDLQNYKQPTPKWMNSAWDAFRIVDNHSKSMIFQLPEDSKNEEYSKYIKIVQNPITLEAIRNKLNLRLYNDLEEFVQDMNTLFNNWIAFRGREHKMYKYCDAVQKRFDKYIEKARQKNQGI